MKTNNTPAKQITVKRSEWNETAKRLECAGWYYIGTPTATGKTIYRRDNSEIEIIIEEEPTTTPSTMNAKETTANNIRESISRLRYELQQYHDNANKGGTERRRNMILLRWDIRKLERQLKAMETETLYRVTTTASGIYSDFCDRHIAEKELNNLHNNGKAATLTVIAI